MPVIKEDGWHKRRIAAAYKVAFFSTGSANPHCRVSAIALWHGYNAGLVDRDNGFAFTPLQLATYTRGSRHGQT
jgi:hypothetical protein